MQESVLSDSSLAWECRNTVQVALPAAREKAVKVINVWKANGRPGPMMIPVRSRIPRWLLRLVPGSAEGHLQDVAYLGAVYVQDEDYHLAVTKSGQLVFSNEAPVRNLFHSIYRIEEFERWIPAKLQIAFVERVGKRLDEYIQQYERLTR